MILPTVTISNISPSRSGRLAKFLDGKFYVERTSLIGLELADQKVKHVRCDYRSIIEIMAPLLLNYWNTVEKIEQLLAMGDMKFLGKSCDLPFEDGGCQFYIRDCHRPAPIHNAITSYNRHTMRKITDEDPENWQGPDMVYLFDPLQQEWLVSTKLALEREYRSLMQMFLEKE